MIPVFDGGREVGAAEDPLIFLRSGQSFVCSSFFVCLESYGTSNRGSCKEKLGFPRITGSMILLTHDLLQLVFFAYLSAVDGTKFCGC